MSIKDIIPNDWKLVRLSEITELITKGTTPTTNGYQYLDDGVNFVKVESIHTNGTLIPKMFAHIGEDCHDSFKRSQLRNNDILFTIAGALGRSAIVNNEILPANTNQAVAIIRLKNAEYLNYIFHYLRGNHVENLIGKINVSTAQANLSLGQINQFEIPLPPQPEQQKIAEILSTVDDKIEVIDQQIIETQELKKGLMQRLLTKGIGHTEFKDSPLGMIPESWEVVKCDSIADITSSKRVYLSDYTDIGIPFFRGKEITQLAKGEKLNDLVYIKEDTFIEFKNRFGAPKEGDILITAVGTIGSIYMVNSTDNFYFKDGNLIWLRKIDSRLNRQFITHYFRSIIFQNLIDIISSGSSQKALTIVKFKLLPAVIPPLDEQIKISEILDCVYEKVSVLEEKKTHYQELKQGLMQQLLTGKIRVKVQHN